jgi:molecular chaperone Hsp33
VDLYSGEVDEDLESYLIKSEQMPSALRCDVALDASGNVAWAGGVLVQTAPGASPEAMVPAAEQVVDGWLLERLRGADDVHAEMSALLGHPTRMLEWRDVRFHCACDGERVLDALRTLGTDDLRDMVRAGEHVEVGCRFCGRQHLVSPAQIKTLLDEPTGAN